jgi:hypothetical protein
MPIHDWTKVGAVIFHDFQSCWIHILKRELNDGLLPSGYYAISERVNTKSSSKIPYKQNRLTVRNSSDDRVIAAIEIVWPGDKESELALWTFVLQSTDLLAKKIHLLLIDLFPRYPREQCGIISSIQEELMGSVIELSAEKPCTLDAYEAESPLTTYVDWVAIGDELPDMPLFLLRGYYVSLPLEKTYLKAWEGVPLRWRKVIGPQSPE